MRDLVNEVSSRILKICTLGEGGVGKTTLLGNYVDRKFWEDTRLTIGVEFFLEGLTVDGKKVKLQVWDLGGQDQFKFLHDFYVAGVKGGLLMFDLTRPLTIEKLAPWVKLCRSVNENAPLILVGTKKDMSDQACVDDDIALKYKKKYNCIDYVKTSAKTGENVDLVFRLLAEAILDQERKA